MKGRCLNCDHHLGLMVPTWWFSWRFCTGNCKAEYCRRWWRSAYSRPGGAEAYCYVKDVPAGEIARYRASH